jgi:hypothetical protein
LPSSLICCMVGYQIQPYIILSAFYGITARRNRKIPPTNPRLTIFLDSTVHDGPLCFTTHP